MTLDNQQDRHRIEPARKTKEDLSALVRPNREADRTENSKAFLQLAPENKENLERFIKNPKEFSGLQGEIIRALLKNAPNPVDFSDMPGYMMDVSRVRAHLLTLMPQLGIYAVNARKGQYLLTDELHNGDLVQLPVDSEQAKKMHNPEVASASTYLIFSEGTLYPYIRNKERQVLEILLNNDGEAADGIEYEKFAHLFQKKTEGEQTREGLENNIKYLMSMLNTKLNALGFSIHFYREKGKVFISTGEPKSKKITQKTDDLPKAKPSKREVEKVQIQLTDWREVLQRMDEELPQWVIDLFEFQFMNKPYFSDSEKSLLAELLVRYPDGISPTEVPQRMIKMSDSINEKLMYLRIDNKLFVEYFPDEGLVLHYRKR